MTSNIVTETNTRWSASSTALQKNIKAEKCEPDQSSRVTVMGESDDGRIMSCRNGVGSQRWDVHGSSITKSLKFMTEKL